METDIDRLELKVKQIESNIAYCKEVLQKADKYERLMEDSDFRDFLKDFEEGFSIHEKEVASSLDMLTTAGPRNQEDLFKIILINQSKKEMVKALVDRPKQIVQLAKEKRKELPILEEELSRSKGEYHA